MNNRNELENTALRIIETISKESNAKWKPTSKYIKYRTLEIDKRGSFGERFVFACLSTLGVGRKFLYNDGNQGDWDLKFNNKKYEIKTSSLDVNNKFQNERIKRNIDLNGIIFVGLAPDSLYLKCIKYSDIPFAKLHNREKAKTGAGYKWDFKESEMELIETPEDVWEIFKKNFN